MKPEQTSPVSFPVNILRLPQKGMPVQITAAAEQRAEIAKLHGLISVDEFRADILVQGWKREGVRVSGRVEGTVTQACIVTLEPLDAHISEDIDALFVPEGSKLVHPEEDHGGEILLDAEGSDSPEVFTGGTIDVGALAEEFFALGIDPYPRKADAVMDQPETRDAETSPFANLRSLKLKG